MDYSWRYYKNGRSTKKEIEEAQVSKQIIDPLEGTAVEEFARQLTEEGFKVIITVDPDISKYDIEEKE